MMGDGTLRRAFTPRRLRILMMIHTPWRPELGAPRAQMEIGEELTALGDHVEKFSYEDAFPDDRTKRLDGTGRWSRRLSALARYASSNRSFAARAKRYVRENAHRFDIIDANQTDLPFSKTSLGFSGLLVARSVGLIPVYAEFERWAAKRWPEPPSLRRLVHDGLTWPGRRRRRRDAIRSLLHADLINVSNRDDLERVRSEMGFDSKVVRFPLGISAGRLEDLNRAAAPPEQRLAARTVAFVGTWNSRKGARDWPRIISSVVREVPEARFLLLGTGLDSHAVLRDIPETLWPSVEVVPGFESDSLPARLSGATAGAFPGYLEGFGISVLEKLGAGLPTVTYDAPGPRDTMSELSIPSTVAVGDVAAFSRALVEILRLSPEQYATRSADARRAASCFEWSRIARETRASYLKALETIERGSETGRPEGRH